MRELSICAGWKTGTVDEAPRSAAQIPRYQPRDSQLGAPLGSVPNSSGRSTSGTKRATRRRSHQAARQQSRPSLAIAVPGISLRQLWLLNPVERRKGRPGAHVAAWWSASEVLVLAGAAELPGSHALGWDVVNAATIPGENENISVSTGHGVRATRESSRCVQPQLARCDIVLARAPIRSGLGATLSKNDARATSLDAASDRSRIVLVKRPGTITAYAACRTGGSPSHHFGRTPNPKIRPYSKNTAYSVRRINPATDRMRSTNAQIWIRHFRYAADHGASGR